MCSCEYPGRLLGLAAAGEEAFLVAVDPHDALAGLEIEVQSYDVYFLQAARVRRMISDSFNKAFTECDLIVCPSSAGTAMPLDSGLSPLEFYALDLFTVAMNLAGVPACSVPAGLSTNGLPLGMQVVGNRFDDMRVLQLAKHIETAAAIDNRPTTIMGK